MSVPLRIGVVGAGSNSAGHLEACRVTGAAQVVAICDIVKERAEKRQEQFGIERVYTDYHELLKNEELDAIVVSIPNYIHHEVAIAGLDAGLNVLCEKPMTIRVDWAEQMVSAARKSGKLLQVGMSARNRLEAQWLKGQIEAGELGKVYFGRAQYVRRWGIPGWGSWFTRKEMSGGGPLIDVGVHALDLTWYLMGCPKPVSVQGVTYSELGPEKRGIGSWGRADMDGFFNVEDFATALIRFENGAAISLEAGWAGFTAPSSTISVMGTLKGAELQQEKVLMLSQGEDGPVDTVIETPAHKVSNFTRQMERFCQAVRGEGPCWAPAEHGLAVVKMLVAIYESARTHTEVKLV